MIYGHPLQVQVHVMASGELLEGSAYMCLLILIL